MKNQFVTYEIALKLKGLGFDELCFGYFNGDKQLLLSNRSKDAKFIPWFYKNSNAPKWLGSIFRPNKRKNICTAPLWQQVTDWLREKHNIDITIHRSFSMTKSYHYCIVVDNDYDNEIQQTVKPDRNYYSIREQAILKAIELCQKKKS